MLTAMPIDQNTSDGEGPSQFTPRGIRAAHFPTGRHGYDPDAVRMFLDRVADEVGRLHEQLAAAEAEADRMKRRMRQWQAEHTSNCPPPTVPAPQPRPSRGREPWQPSRDRWPINHP